MGPTLETIRRLILVGICLGIWGFSQAQYLVWPGDINRNGVVNTIDLLYYGIARNSEGPERANQTTQWIGVPPPDPWDGFFSNGINYCEADVDGRGRVEKKDRDVVLDDNYGRTQGIVTPDVFLVGNPATDPTLLLVPQETSIEPKKRLKIDVYLGDAARPANDVFGLAFTVNFNPDLVADESDNKLHKPQKVRFKLTNNTWLDGSGDLKSEEYARLTNENGTLDVVILRKDATQGSGYGKIGELEIVMEDIVLDYDEDLPLYVNQIKMIDLNMNENPVASSSTTVTVTANAADDYNADDCCNDGDKPQRIAVTYTGEDCYATYTSQEAGEYDCAGDPDYAQSVYIIANEKVDPYDGDVWFTGTVDLGESFVIDALLSGDDELKSRVFVHIFEYPGGPLLQIVHFRSDCNQALQVGDQYGAILFDGILFKDGATCGNAPQSDCCDEGDRPQVLEVTYTGEGANATDTRQESNDYGVSGNANYDSQVYIIANEKSDPYDGKIWFMGNVTLGSTFPIDATWAGENELKSTTYIHIYASQGGAKLQTIYFKTDCSEPLLAEDQYGAIAIESILFKNDFYCSDGGQGSLNSYEPEGGNTQTWLDAGRGASSRINNGRTAPAGGQVLNRAGLPAPTEGLFRTNGVLVYPNPVGEELWVEMPDRNEELKRIELYDRLGKLLYAGETTERFKHRIQMSAYPAGIYMLRIHTSKNVMSYRIVK